MRFRTRLALALAALFAPVTIASCSSDDTPADAAGGAGAAGSAGAAGAGGADAGPGKRVAPELYDCRAKASPPRTNPVPTTCATDPACTTRLVSAHRAAGGDLGVIAPENTVSAVRAAIALGVDFIETDPRPSKDGVIVNVHDTDVGRVTTGTGKVADMTLAELRALPLKTSKYEGDFSCEHIATLTEILAAARGRIHVLLDGNKSDDVAGLIAAIHETDTLDWAIFDTDSQAKIDAALAIEPKLHTMIRVATTTELSSELAHFAQHPPVIVEIHGDGTPESLAPAIHAAKNRALMDVFVVDVSTGFDGKVASYGDVYARGIDIVQTDRPDLVMSFLGR